MNALLNSTHLTGSRLALAPFDSGKFLPDPGPELRQRVETLRARARAEKADAAEEQRDRYMAERLMQAVFVGPDGRRHRESQAVILRALNDRVLGPDFVLHLQSVEDPRQIEYATVAECQADPKRYHGRLLRDPLEPDYSGGGFVGKIFLRASRPRVVSFAHGGTTYRLDGRLPVVVIHPGRMAEAVTETLRHMRTSGLFFDLGDLIVTVRSKRPRILNEHALANRLGQILRFRKVAKEGEVDIDPPEKLCRQILGIGKEDRRLPGLRGIATGPYIRPDFTLNDSAGFDEATGRYAHFVEADFPPVPEAPDREMLLAAHKILWEPFRETRFASRACRTSFLAALLTAVERPVLDKAPMFVSVSPAHGSGKTLMTEAVGALAIGDRPPMMATIDPSNNEEMRKRLTAALLPPAEPVLIFDNMAGEQTSSELANFLTAESRTDRILGMSRLETELPNRALVLMSGKNLSFSQEFARRVLTWHIDPGERGVFDNAFTACPVETVLDRRPEMMVAALTLIRGAHLSRRKLTQNKTPSYGQWDLLVRQTILWITEELLPGHYEDPLNLLDAASASTGDQTDTYELLWLLHQRYGDGFFKASDLSTAVAIGDAELRTQLDGLARGRGEPLSAKSIGRYLRGLLNQKFGDLRMRNRLRGHMCEWAVERL